jgi:hypothetical protein
MRELVGFLTGEGSTQGDPHAVKQKCGDYQSERSQEPETAH